VSISIFCLLCYLFVSLAGYFFFSDGTMVELLKGEEEEDDDVALDTCW
jgi:Tfp pilus assembly protein PilO